jgi:hypothetical protein
VRRRDISVQRYPGDFVAGSDRCMHQATVAPMFTLPAVAVAITWANGSHNAKAIKPGPLGHLGGAT